jgi:hypothetical protein
MPVVTLPEMTAALRETLGRKGLTEDQVTTLADYVMSFFGFGTEVVDNLLKVEDRDVFYMLEEQGILTTKQEEVRLKKGRLWRIHYWVLRVDYIKELANTKAVKKRDEFVAVYEEMPEEAWARPRMP